MRRSGIIFLSVLLFAIFIVVDIYIETNYPVLETVNLKSGKLPAGSSVRILQISDLHDKSFGEGQDRLLELVRKANPDMLAITGDLADRTTTDFTGIYRLISEMKKQIPDIYYVPGNHEQSSRLMGRFLGGLSERGVTLLMDTASVFIKGSLKVNICGINYPFKETSLDFGPVAEMNALGKASENMDMSKFTVLLSHSPTVVRSIREGRFDLVLAGHTHGGQVRLPFVGSFILPEPDLHGRYDKGLYTINGGLELYVDSGLGTSLLPVRFNDRAEVTLLTICGR